MDETFFAGISFTGSDKSYYFSTIYGDLKIGDLVIVETINGPEIGRVTIAPAPVSLYRGTLELKPILRKPDTEDLTNFEINKDKAKKALEITQREIDALKLPMDLLEAVYTLDRSRVTITYTSTEKRVDFRELLKHIVPLLGAKIELRQIASRDKAKMIGGLGICGLPLCCSTFLDQFEGISIAKAKNQMLTLNIPKLSGPCGKLICCLAYEDETYTEEKKMFPHLGTIVHLDEGDYTIDAINIINKTVRCVNSGHNDYKTYSLEDMNAIIAGTYVKKENPSKKQDEYTPNFGVIPDLSNKQRREENPKPEEKREQPPKQQQQRWQRPNKNRHNNHQGHNNQHDQRRNQNNPQQHNNNQNQTPGNNKNKPGKK